jgi:hypothetical protein
MKYRVLMRFPDRTTLALGTLLLANTALAVPANLKEHYQPIIDRNPFGLKPPPPPPTNNVAPPPVEKPKTEIFMTGIVSIGYPKWPKKVFLKTQEANKKDAIKFYELAEGMENDGIRVLSIDEVNRKVRIKTDTGETLLSFQTHGIAPPAGGAAMPGQPGMQPGQPGMPPPLPGGNPNMPAGPVNQFPQNQNQAQPINNSGVATPQNNFRTIPSRNIRSRLPGGTDFNGGVVTPNVPNGGVPGGGGEQPQLDPAEQYLRMHLDKAAREKQGIPMPPLPPAN